MLNATTLEKEFPVLAAVKNQPCISVIIPFNPKMISKNDLAAALKNVYKQVKENLYNNYTDKASNELLDKLRQVIGNLDYTTHKKSIALYVSPVVEQVYYLDIDVHEKVIVDTSFEIRDIVHNKKDDHEFLLLSISSKHENIYVGNSINLRKIVSNNIEHVQRDLPGVVANFTDANKVKETRLKKFLHYIDNGLPLIFKAYSLPLFVAGTEKTLGYFRRITKHQAQIAGFINGNFDNVTEAELRKLFALQLRNWKLVKENYLRNRIKIAQNNLQLATGIHDVWIYANRRYKQLLIVEKDFYCPAFVTAKGETIFSKGNEQNEVIAKDAVDDVIEKVLQNGGDVEFIDDLKDYNRIALIDVQNKNELRLLHEARSSYPL
jgi:hypothetical protein